MTNQEQFIHFYQLDLKYPDQKTKENMLSSWNNLSEINKKEVIEIIINAERLVENSIELKSFSCPMLGKIKTGLEFAIYDLKKKGEYKNIAESEEFTYSEEELKIERLRKQALEIATDPNTPLGVASIYGALHQMTNRETKPTEENIPR